MPAVIDDRSFDLVLFGATGFTGGLTAEYLARSGPASLRWAIAGRNRAKLEAVRERLEAIGGAAPVPELLIADVGDRGSLDAVAAAARVVLTTVGPYSLYGEPLVAACAAAGTDYADLTGEPGFVDRMWTRHHAQAERSGARLVHCCGFDSIPHDLGAYFTVQQLPEGVPLRVDGYAQVGAEFSGGTHHSAVNGLARPWQTLGAARQRRVEEPRSSRGIHSAPARIGRAPGGGWAAPLPTIDGAVVRRSAAALERYGPDFTYGHHLRAKHLTSIAALAGGVAAAAAMAPLPPTRKLLMTVLRSSGEGPSPETRAKSWFKVTFVGEGGGERVVTEVSGGDPGYDETAKMLAESGLCLAFDRLPQTAGQVTTATAMGDALTARLRGAGIEFRVVEGR
jgi:short subunit dehydrogenase-like uncharacterized protein